MHWVIQFFVRQRVLTSLILLVGASLWMLVSPPRRQAAVARTLTISVFLPVDLVVAQARRVRNVFAENERLRVQLVAVNTRLALLEEQAAEYGRLRTQVGFAAQTSHDLVPVRVVARDPGHLFRSVVVDAGANRGFVRYLPLLTGQGLAGRIVQVMPHVSLVQLLRDPSNRASVMTRRSRVSGILQCENGVDLFARHRSADTMAVGDTVITSGLGGVYPKGLLVGTVTRLADDENVLFRRAIVKPFVNFERIEEAYVMRLAPQWAAFRDELDSLDYGR